ncbi:MAG: bifunctional lysylphosphatidylglycerol flippase/synthetase MprF [Maritimibacter sp.]|nr:bifunctional lysylphosphatidylglycerol flippase/synthetase MprF [Maritimibacter sp.]
MTATTPDTRVRRWLGLLDHPLARAALPVAVFGLALVLLHSVSREIHPGDVRAALAATRPDRVALGIGFTALAFIGIALYDVFATRAVAPGQVPAPVAAAAGATGSAISNLLGFTYLTGAGVRYRIYAGYGLDIVAVAAVLSTVWSALWTGFLLLLGVVLLLFPHGTIGVLPLSALAERLIGLGCLAALAGYLLFLSFGPRRIRVFGNAVGLPSPRQSLALTGAALVDIAASAAVLYVLLPPDLAGNPAGFFTIYVAAIVLAIASHAPGGIGVFEATVLAGLGASGRADALAALVLYRLVYTALPFALAALALAGGEIVSRRGALTPKLALIRSVVRPMVPFLSAAVALAAGSVLLISGNLPAVGDRLKALETFVPLGAVELSHLAGSVAGVLLLVVARGLYRRLYSAWATALVLLGVGFVASLGKGIDVEEALVAAAAAAILVVFRRAFHRVDRAAPLHIGPGWFAAIAVLFAALTWIGLFAYKHVEYRDALWWQVTWAGDASRFLRASLAGAVVLAALALNSLLGARGRRHRPEPIPDAVRRLIADSPDAQANLALLGDKSFLVDPEERAYLAFADTGRSLVSANDPVGETGAAQALLWEFRELADREGKRAVFYGVSERFLPSYLDMGFDVVKFGEVARVDLTGFTLDTPAMKDFRYARNRAQRDGYSFEVLPAADLPAVLPEIRRVSDAWLAHKEGREKGFTIGAFDAAYLANFDTAVLRAPGTGEIVAFANLLRGAGVELSVDLMRYRPDGPKVAMDALFAEIMLWAAARGFACFSLGAAPFSGTETHALASPWQRIGSFVFEHGEAFYHFEGLRSYKQKFAPTWSPNYLACERGLGVVRAFLDANSLISGR